MLVLVAVYNGITNAFIGVLCFRPLSLGGKGELGGVNPSVQWSAAKMEQGEKRTGVRLLSKITLDRYLRYTDLNRKFR